MGGQFRTVANAEEKSWAICGGGKFGEEQDVERAEKGLKNKQTREGNRSVTSSPYHPFYIILMLKSNF
jgi:hypothetical protein